MNTNTPVADNAQPAKIRHVIILGLAAIVILIVYGLIRFPTVLIASSDGAKGILGIAIILGLYGIVAWAGPGYMEMVNPYGFRAGIVAGLIAGLIFLSEIILEYVLLPQDNSAYGLLEYGLVSAVFLAVSLWVTYRTNAFRNGLTSAIESAMIAQVIWYIVVLLVFYIFAGTPQQTQVFRAEGNFDDFAHSGLTDFNAFIMGDFMGAGFFHAILLPLSAAILGTMGGLIGKILARLRRRASSP